MYIYQPEREVLKKAIFDLAPQLGGKVLDIGSGKAMRYKNYFSRATQYLRADLDALAEPDVVCSVTEMPFESNSFDSVVCTQVLGDIPEPELAAKEIMRVLKTGGMALITEGMVGSLHSEPRDYWRFTPHGMRYIFEKFGARVIEVDLVGGVATASLQMQASFLIDVFNLYNRPWLGAIASKMFYILGVVSMFVDDLVYKRLWPKIGTNVVLLVTKL